MRPEHSADPVGLDRRTRSELYAEAARLGIKGRSKMDRRALAEAIAAAQRRPRRAPLLGEGPDLARVSRRWRSALRQGRAAGLAGVALLGGLTSSARTPRPLRAVLLSVAALATGGLGLLVAYAVVPQESGAAQQQPAPSLELVTVTGPGGTTTLAVTKTKKGKTKLVPVRVLRTVTGPGGVRTLATLVPGPVVTQRNTVTQSQTQTQTQTQTQVVTVTQFEPVTVTSVVNQVETVVVTETAVVEVTVTVPPAP